MLRNASRRPRAGNGREARGEDATCCRFTIPVTAWSISRWPIVPEDLTWEGLVDTNQDATAGFSFGTVYAVTGRSLVAFGLVASLGPRWLCGLRESGRSA